ncbi:hypothetical protein GJAV_G00207620 [Gymnothorax javanicus]|nr:hypothetical protein GJAV_G00207620 [Gymnothorax javanicus]
MKSILFTIIAMHQCYLALGALPAPINVTITSVNFEHILQWKPGFGTPPGAAYRIEYSCRGKRLKLEPSFLNSSVTVLNLTGTFKNPKKPYGVHIQTLHGGMKSPRSSLLFCPYTETVLGPPLVSVTGRGDSLHLNITLPRGKANESIEKIYHNVQFSVFWKKAGEIQELKVTTESSEHIIKNLYQGVEYCVRVQPEITENPNLLSSDWSCQFTSPSSVNPVPIVLGCVSISLVLGGASLLILSYTGFLCKLNSKPPRALMSLVHSHFLTVDITAVDEVTVISETEGRGSTAEGGAGDDDEEEDVGNGGYESRAAGFSGAASSGSGSSVTPLTTDTSVSGDSGNSQASMHSVPLECRAQCSEEALCVNKGALTGPSLFKQVQGEGVDIDLLSVTLGAQDEEEEEGGEEEVSVAELQSMDGADEHQSLFSVEMREGSRLMECGSSRPEKTVHSYMSHSSSQSECRKTHSTSSGQTDCLRTQYLQLQYEDSVKLDTQSAEEDDCSGYMLR